MFISSFGEFGLAIGQMEKRIFEENDRYNNIEED